MISALRACLIRLHQRAVGLSMFLALMINAVLLGAFLYVVLPQYNQTFDGPDMMKRVDALSHSISVDIVNVWAVNLAQNQRTYIGSHVLDPADRKAVDTYVATAKTQSFTQTIPAEVALDLMNGNTSCHNVYGVPGATPNSDKFRKAIGSRIVCWVPILSPQQTLIGYAAFIWKDVISQEEIANFMSRSIGLVNKR